MTVYDLIKETVEYYETDPKRRATHEGTCVYYDSQTGNMCAVGRCLRDPFLYAGRTDSAPALFFKEGIEILKDEYEGIPLTFWTDLQIYHDSSIYWDYADYDRYLHIQHLLQHNCPNTDHDAILSLIPYRPECQT